MCFTVFKTRVQREFFEENFLNQQICTTTMVMKLLKLINYDFLGFLRRVKAVKNSINYYNEGAHYRMRIFSDLHWKDWESLHELVGRDFLTRVKTSLFILGTLKKRLVLTLVRKSHPFFSTCIVSSSDFAQYVMQML